MVFNHCTVGLISWEEHVGNQSRAHVAGRQHSCDCASQSVATPREEHCRSPRYALLPRTVDVREMM